MQRERLVVCRMLKSCSLSLGRSQMSRRIVRKYVQMIKYGINQEHIAGAVMLY